MWTGCSNRLASPTMSRKSSTDPALRILRKMSSSCSPSVPRSASITALIWLCFLVAAWTCITKSSRCAATLSETAKRHSWFDMTQGVHRGRRSSHSEILGQALSGFKAGGRTNLDLASSTGWRVEFSVRVTRGPDRRRQMDRYLDRRSERGLSCAPPRIGGTRGDPLRVLASTVALSCSARIDSDTSQTAQELVGKQTLPTRGHVARQLCISIYSPRSTRKAKSV